MAKEKIYRAGTKITFHSNCNYVGCEEREVVTLDEDRTETSLNEEAYERAVETVQVEGWFTTGEEDEE